MICKNCGAALADDCIFCSSCGSKLEPEPTGEAATMMDSGFRGTGNLVESDLVAHIPQEEVGIAPQFSVAFAPEDAAAFLTDEDPRCPNCGEIPEAGALFCNHCGTKLCESVPQNAAETPPAGRARKFPIKWVCIASGAVLLLIIIILIVGAATNWFGAKGPAAQIGSAFKNTFSAESYTVDFSFSYDEYRIADTRGIGTAYFVLQPAQRNFTMYIDVVLDDESAVFAIYDGYYIVSYESGTWAIDISDELDEYFNAYEEAQSMDSSLKNISWKKLIDNVSYDGAYDEASEYVDFDNLSRCLTDYLMKLNDEKWLQDRHRAQRSPCS